MILKNKIALIVGGAGGIGQAVASLFLKEGARVIIASRSEADLISVSEKLNAIYSGRISFLVVDVSVASAVKKMVEQVISDYGAINILISGAGIYGPIGLSHEVDLDDWIKTYEVNVFGTFNLFRAVVPHMIKQGGGKIVNFSGGGDGPLPRFSAYNSSKAAIVRLTETLAEEVKEWNIEVNCIAPGAVNTKLLDEALRAGEAKLGHQKYSELLKQKQGGGVLPEKAAQLCLFLGSSKSDGLSGRFLSAVWDNYEEWDEDKIKSIMSQNLYTYRRVK
jgi:3-oxoacyl-[acyl-carrier protein] reductase